MNRRIEQLVSGLETRPGASQDAIDSLCDCLCIRPPNQYLDFLRWSDGGEGWIGDRQNSYLIIYSIEEAIAARGHFLEAGAPDWVVLFGSSGGGSGYAFDARTESMPIIETDWCFEVTERRGSTFLEFLEFLASEDRE